MNIILYKYSGEIKEVNKESKLKPIVKIVGTLKTSTSIISPSIQFNSDYNINVNLLTPEDKIVLNEENKKIVFTEKLVYKILSCNYAYIEDFKRYYYITDIISVTSTLWQLNMNIDVLYSHKESILNQTAFVTRNEFEYDPMIRDNYLSLKYDKEITEEFITNLGDNRGLKNFSFSTSFLNDLKLNMIINVIEEGTKGVFLTHDYIYNPFDFDTVLPFAIDNITTGNVSYSKSYVFSARDLQSLIYRTVGNSSLTSYILNILIFPFEIESKTTSKYLKLGTTELKPTSSGGDGVYVNELFNQVSPYRILADFTIIADSFLDYEPYTTYDIFIPYLGWKSLNADEILNNRLVLIYNIDYKSGSSQVNLYDVTNGKIVLTSQCQLGISIPISSTNEFEVNNNRISNNISLGLGVASSVLSTTMGISTGNPVAVAGGVLSGAKSISSFIDNNNKNVVRASGTVGSGNAGVYLPQEVIVRKTKYKLNEYNGSYYKLFGRPLNKFKKLSDLKGITEVGEIHLENIESTKTELDLIESLLKQGVIL